MYQGSHIGKISDRDSFDLGIINTCTIKLITNDATLEHQA
jgi:hypothetical protein